MNRSSRHILIYDGDCAFCQWWVDYWRTLGDGVDFRPFQAGLEEFPGLDQQSCRESIQFITPQGEIFAGARAAFLVLAVNGYAIWLRVYQLHPWLARAFEFAYGWIARRRDTALAGARFLWGDARVAARYERAGILFSRAIALFYLVAFASLWTQWRGLYGATGIAPISVFLDSAAIALGPDAYLQLPSVFWLASGDAWLEFSLGAGMGLSILALLPRLTTLCLAGCFAIYLSWFSVGQPFMSFQWDLLLLEAGFLSLFLGTRHPAVPFLFKCLLFRFMFLSGCVKLLSGDAAWATLSALEFHYETQPLPTPLAWYAHHLADWFHHLCVAVTFVIELVFPFLIFLPRRPRMLAAAGFLGLEALIFLTGNYNFFNLLTVALVIFLFEDQQLRQQSRHRGPTSGVFGRKVISTTAAVVIALNLYYLARPFVGRSMPVLVDRTVARVAPLRIVNGYGLFAVMTTTRPEIEIQGSNNGLQWQAYEFVYKPGPVDRPLRWNIPHQPRLDWQMWFAALSDARREYWFGNLMQRLLVGEPAVLDLFAANPFPTSPPRYLRAVLYEYSFASPQQRQRTGAIWQRRASGLFYPRVNLQPDT